MAETERPILITEPKLLLVEGKDDKLFFESLIRFLRIPSIQVHSVDGIGNLRPKLRAIINQAGFQTLVTSVGIVRDADKSSVSAFQSVCDAVRSVGLAAPLRMLEKAGTKPSVIIMISPHDKKRGMLEDICLNSIDRDSVRCIEEYITCMKTNGRYSSKNTAKSKVHSYLSVQKDPSADLGESAAQKCWDFNHEAFAGIKKLLKSM